MPKISNMEFNEKQIRILTVVEKLFSELGFDGTSLRQIAKEADINIAMVSYYFGSKEKMLESLIQYRMGDFRLQMDAAMKNDELDYLQRIDKIIEMLIKRMYKNRRIYKIVHFEYSSKSRSKIDFKCYVDQKKETYALIKNFIENGQEAGVYSKNINIGLVIPTILGTFFHFLYNQQFFAELYTIDDEDSLKKFTTTTLTQHIQQTIKALLTNEK